MVDIKTTTVISFNHFARSDAFPRQAAVFPISSVTAFREVQIKTERLPELCAASGGGAVLSKCTTKRREMYQCRPGIVLAAFTAADSLLGLSSS